jgi:hypothetical protein
MISLRTDTICLVWSQFTIAVTRRVLAPAQAAALDVAAFQVVSRLAQTFSKACLLKAP